jgi:predicted MPP superfamily phosphohydrolase
VLRDFIRSVLFERFPLAAGVAVGVAQALLVAVALVLVGGLETLAAGPLALAGAGLVTAHAWGVPRLGLSRPRSPLGRSLASLYLGIGFASIGFAAALVAFALGSACLAALLAFAGLPAELGFALFRGGSAAVTAATAVALGWGFAAGPRGLEVTSIRVEISGLARSLAGLRIAQLTDLHIGNGVEGDRLAGMVERSNALGADLVVLTGDLFDHDPQALVAGARGLAGLRARLGVFAVLGNHDLFAGGERVAAALAEHAPAIRLLRGERVRVPAPAPLYLAGLDDPGRDWTAGGGTLPAIAALAADLPGDGPTILLVHRPDAFPQAAALGFPLVLAGHFHGGQIALPLGGGRWNAARLISPFHRGVYRVGASTLYVSRGLGFAGPRIRLGSVPEIALIELTASSAPPH